MVGIAIRSWAKSFEWCAQGNGPIVDSDIDTTTLKKERQRTKHYILTTGACGQSLDGNQVSLWRTFRFPLQAEDTTVTEVGFSWSGNSTSHLFSRVNLGSAVPIHAGEYLQVKYTLVLTLTPADSVAQSVSPDFTGFSSVLATQNWQSVCLDGINALGETASNFAAGGSAVSCMEPSVGGRAFLSDSSDALLPFGQDTNRGLGTLFSKEVSLGDLSYTPGATYSRTKSISLDSSEGNGSWSSFGLTIPETPGLVNGFVVLWDSAKVKDALFTWELNFNFVWQRELE